MGCKVIIIGGVAGGATAAARLRRLDEFAEITIIERGGEISYANCGLPYYIGGVIARRESLLVQTPETMKSWFNLDVRIKSEVLRIKRDEKKVEVKDLSTGERYWLDYDYLVLSPGAAPLKPPIPGSDKPNVFTVRSIPDSNRILGWI